MKRFGRVFIPALVVAAAATAQLPPKVETVTGTGAPGDSGDGGAAVAASLNRPSDVMAAPWGDIFIVDTGNHRLRRVGANGLIETVAGTGVAGYSGDGGPATQAQMDTPHGIFVDSLGTILICDTRNNRVRAIDGEGVMRTLAGNGAASFSGDEGAATDASLNRPHGIALSAGGGLLIADTNNHRIRRVADGMISTVAGNGTPGFSGDGGAATDAQLNGPVDVDVSGEVFYLSDRDNHRVRRVAGGAIQTVAGNGIPGYEGDGGPATDASMRRPRGLAVTAAGLLILADRDNNVIRMIDPTGVIQTIVGTGEGGYNGDGNPGLATMLQSPRGLFVDAGSRVLIADRENHRIRSFPLDAGEVRPPARPADFNGDGKVDFGDFLEFVNGFGRREGEAGFEAKLDLDGDRRVAFGDFLIFAGAFGK